MGQPDAEDLRLAQWMFALVLGLQPKAREPNFERWADVIRLMRTRDGHERREIAALFRWANGHAFWQSNILSPGKLREKWDQLVIRRQGEQAGTAPAAAAPVIDHRCAFHEHGARCTRPGVTSAGTHASSPWYCAEHLERVESGDVGDGAGPMPPDTVGAFDAVLAVPPGVERVRVIAGRIHGPGLREAKP